MNNSQPTSVKILLLALLTPFFLSSCSKKKDDAVAESTTNSQLFVVTGACNSGVGITTYTTTATRTIESYHSDTGSHLSTLLDYNVPGTLVAATHPRSIVDIGSALLILNENATTTSERKVINVPKSSPSSFSTFYANPAVFTGVMLGLSKDTDGNLLIGKSTAIEKINVTPIRVPAGTNPWVSAPGGACATSTTAISNVVSLPPVSAGAGKVVFSHQGATAALNRIGIISANGYFAPADCLSGVQINSITHTKASNLTQGAVAFNASGTSPTSMVFIKQPNGTKTGKLVVSYANGQTSNNNAGVYNLNHGIVMWDVDEPDDLSATLSNPVVVYDNTSVLYAISSMTYDPVQSVLYVATGGESGAVNQTTNGYGYNIEKFAVLMNATSSPTLTRVAPAGQPFIKGGVSTRCISGMALGD